MEASIEHRGFLLKQGHIVMSWKNRYCCLEKNISSGTWTINYFTAANMKQQKGKVELLKARLEVTDSKEGKFVVREGLKGSRRSYPFKCTSSDNDYTMWVSKIQRAITDSNEFHSRSELESVRDLPNDIRRAVHFPGARPISATITSLPNKRSSTRSRRGLSATLSSRRFSGLAVFFHSMQYRKLDAKDFIGTSFPPTATSKERFRLAARRIILLKTLVGRLGSLDHTEVTQAIHIMKIITQGPKIARILYDFQADLPLIMLLSLSEDGKHRTIVDALTLLSRLVKSDFRFAERLLKQRTYSVDEKLRTFLRSVKVELRAKATWFVNDVIGAFMAHLQEHQLFDSVYLELLLRDVRSSETSGMNLEASLSTIENITSSSCAATAALIITHDKNRASSESRLFPLLLHRALSSKSNRIKYLSVCSARNIGLVSK